MKQTRWIKKTAACLALGAVLAGTETAVCDPCTVFGAQGASYEQIVNAQQGLSSSVVNERHYVVYRADDDDESSGRVYREEDRTTGPGAAAEVEIVEDEEPDGPKVEEVSLSERHHEDFGVYEEDMGNRYFLYATVENGGITDQPVSVDIPAGLTFVMEKDGVQIPYASGQTVSARGSYMLTLTGPDDPSLPFSEQTIYKAVFRFRIQERLVPETEEAAEAFAPGSYGSDRGSSFEETAPAVEETIPETEPQTEETEVSSETDAETEEETISADVFNEDGSLNEEALESSIEDLVGADEGRIDMDRYSEVTGLSSFYDSSSGLFKNELLTGAAFYTNVPNGMVTNSAVRMDTADEIQFTVLKDGEALEYVPGMVFEEAGSYMIYPSQNTTVYLGEYGIDKRPQFHFRIVTGPIRDMGIFNAPQDYEIQEVTLDGRPVTDGVFTDYCSLSEDGEYKIRLSHKDGETSDLTTTFVKDSIQPRFVLSREKSTVYFHYRSSDIVSCRLYRNGELVSDQQIPSEVSGSGSYRLEAYDAAGNMASSEFQIDYHFNTGAIIVILLVVTLIAALVVFLKRARSQVRVR